MKLPRLTSVRFTGGTDRDLASGLLGYVSLVVGDAVRLDGLTLRRNRSGGVSLSYPARTDGRGRKHPLVAPVDEQVRAEFEREILAKLREGGA